MCLHVTAKSAEANLVCWPQANTKFQLCICLFQWMRSKALYLQIVSLSLCKVGKSATFSLHEIYFAIKDGKLRKECILFFFLNMHVHVSQTIQSCNGLLMHQHGCHLSLLFSFNLHDSRPKWISSILECNCHFFFLCSFLSEKQGEAALSNSVGVISGILFHSINITYKIANSDDHMFMKIVIILLYKLL